MCCVGLGWLVGLVFTLTPALSRWERGLVGWGLKLSFNRLRACPVLDTGVNECGRDARAPEVCLPIWDRFRRGLIVASFGKVVAGQSCFSCLKGATGLVPVERARDRLLRKLSGEISDKRVLDAIAAVPRERFVRPADRHAAYEDVALGIAAGQTISQPTIVAIMIQEMELRRFDRVLEIGTGSGYQAAVLGEIAREVVTVERVPELADSARLLLASLGYGNIRVEHAEGTLGRPQDAPYDAIVVAAAAPKLPQSLINQLEIGGRLIIPVGTLREQRLVKIVRTMDGNVTRALGACRFVPLIGHGAWSETEV